MDSTKARLAQMSSHLIPPTTAMDTISLTHATLPKLTGVAGAIEGVKITQFRGLQYGIIAKRFGAAVPMRYEGGGGGVVGLDCTSFGPICPQNYTSPSVLLRVPERLEDELERQDEFECLNLTITMPGEGNGNKMPVLVWVHGGSQTMTFGSPGSKLCNPRRIVADSFRAGRPIIVVALNYRLNIFGFGDGSETNLALKDQKLGVEWVREHIGGFGGDKDTITLAGESAGAGYTHAHTFIGTPIKRAILMSGSLNLSSPLPLERGKGLIDSLTKKTRESDGCELRDAPVEVLLRNQRESGIVSVWLQATDGLGNWGIRMEGVQELMIGDCEYESVIWRNGIETMTAEQITACFDKAQNAAELKEAYGIVPTRSTACKLGALDFLNDVRFAMPANEIAAKWREAKKPVFQYVVDQPNPWQPSSRAHHAVDLIHLFGGYDIARLNPGAEAVGKQMRGRWIAFVNGDGAWNSDKRYAFGPLGDCGEIGESGYKARRRVEHFEMLKKSNQRDIVNMYMGLAAGRLSLDN